MISLNESYDSFISTQIWKCTGEKEIHNREKLVREKKVYNNLSEVSHSKSYFAYIFETSES